MFLSTWNAKPIESHLPCSLQLITLVVSQVFCISWLTIVSTDHPKNGMDPNTVAGKSCPQRQKRCKDEQPLMIVVFETSPILSLEPQSGSRTNSVPIRYQKQAERSPRSQSNRAPTSNASSDSDVIHERISFGIPDWLNPRSWFTPNRTQNDVTWNLTSIQSILKAVQSYRIPYWVPTKLFSLATPVEFAWPESSLRRNPATDITRSGSAHREGLDVWPGAQVTSWSVAQSPTVELGTISGVASSIYRECHPGANGANQIKWVADGYDGRGFVKLEPKWVKWRWNGWDCGNG